MHASGPEMKARNRQLLIVVSAPSGSGKTTLCDRLLADLGDIVYSVSCTTRQPRGTETDGTDYTFLTKDEFEQQVREGQFLEHATVHGYRYGTLRETVLHALAEGRSVLMDIDVQGAEQIRACVKSGAGDLLDKAFVDIFITPPSIDALRERLEMRGEDTPEVIEKRLENAQREMAQADKYMRVIVNDELDRAYAELRGIVAKETAKDG